MLKARLTPRPRADFAIIAVCQYGQAPLLIPHYSHPPTFQIRRKVTQHCSSEQNAYEVWLTTSPSGDDSRVVFSWNESSHANPDAHATGPYRYSGSLRDDMGETNSFV